MQYKKIIIFINSLTNGGAEKTTIRLSEFLSKKGCEVIIVTKHNKSVDFFPIPEGVRRECIDIVGENKGIKKITENYRRLNKLRSIIKQEKADAIVAMMTTSAVLGIIACIGLNTKVYASERNYPGNRYMPKIWDVLRKVFYRFADGHAAQTYETVNWLKKNTNSKNIHLIPNSLEWPMKINEPKIEPKDLIHENNKVILSVGSRVHIKGFDLLLEAFSLLVGQYKDWLLVIVGMDTQHNSDEYNRLLSHARKYKIINNLVLPGRVNNMQDWYERADIFVLSSRSEGFPNVLLEAMATGCASISFDCDTGPRDIIENKVNGILIDSIDSMSLYDALKRLVTDPTMRKYLSENSISVREKFSEKKIMKKWDRLLNQEVSQ